MSIAGPVLVDVRLGEPRRLSVAASGRQASQESRNPRWGGDGSVLFESPAPDLAPGDDNGTWDVFRLAGTGGPIAVSRDGLGQTGSGASLGGALARDGRRLLFDSSAANLVPLDTNGARDVFVRDLATGAVQLVSASASGEAGHGDSFAGSFTPDGRGVLFESLAPNLVPGDTNRARDLFLKDLATGAITRVSVGPAGEEARGQSGGATLSASGRWLLFESNAPNLVAGDSNGSYDIFLKDLLAGTVRRLSVAADGTQGNGHSLRARFTADESAVVFETLASNLVPGDSNGARDIVQVALATGQVTRLSTGAAGQQANGSSLAASLGSGWLAFETHASNLGGSDGNGRRDIWLRDLATGAMLRVLGAGGAEPNGDSLNPQLSPRGERLLFESFASNLVAGDSNGVRDIFEVAIERTVVAAAGSGSGPALGGLLLFDDPDPQAVHGWTLAAPPSALGSFAAALVVPAAGAAVGALRWSFTPGAGALALRAGEERTLGATLAILGPTGARVEQALSVTLAGAEDPPVAGDDRLALRGGQTSANLLPVLLANDRDPDAGDTLAIARVGPTPQGTLRFDAAAPSLAFTADGALAELPSGAVQPVRFAYWVRDASGREARAEVAVEVQGTRAKAAAGTADADLLAGTIGPDWLDGLAGEDLLEGSEGSDRIDGGSGADRLAGGTGDDTLVVDHAGDMPVEQAGAGLDTVEALVSLVLPAEVEQLQLLGDGLAGTGNAGANRLGGTAGPDRLDGAAGPDWLVGGAGNDVHLVDDAGDVIVELAGGGHDAAETTLAALALPDHVEVLRFTGTGGFAGQGNALDNLLGGGAGSDRLHGLAGADQLDGGAGEDLLDGGPGADRLRGGPGADSFVLRRGEAAGDWILDFDGSGAGPGDALHLAGWGAGTQLAEGPGPQQWTIIDGVDGHRETLRIVGRLDPADILFG